MINIYFYIPHNFEELLYENYNSLGSSDADKIAKMYELFVKDKILFEHFYIVIK